MTHDLKCWPASFEPLWNGRKTAEVRWDDRHYAAGDVLMLREWWPPELRAGKEHRDGYTGAWVEVLVTHLTRNDYGLPAGLVVLSFSRRAHGYNRWPGGD